MVKAGDIDFKKIASLREATHKAYIEHSLEEEHPKDPHGGRFTYKGAHIEEPDHELIPDKAAHEQRRLEQLGISLDDLFDMS